MSRLGLISQALLDAAGTAAATAGALVRRDAEGDAAFRFVESARAYATSTPPAAAHELTRRDYVDNQVAPLLTAPVFRARRNTAQSLPNGAFTAITWDVKDIDTAGMWTGGVDVKIMRAGYYRVTAGVTLAGAPGGRIALRMQKNGAVVYVGRLQANGGVADPGVETSGLIVGAVNDLIKLDVFQDSGGAVNTNSPDFGPSFMELQWLRPL